MYNNGLFFFFFLQMYFYLFYIKPNNILHAFQNSYLFRLSSGQKGKHTQGSKY